MPASACPCARVPNSSPTCGPRWSVLADNPEECREIGRAAVERVRTHFTWSAKAERLVEIYRDFRRSQGDAPKFRSPHRLA